MHTYEWIQCLLETSISTGYELGYTCVFSGNSMTSCILHQILFSIFSWPSTTFVHCKQQTTHNKQQTTYKHKLTTIMIMYLINKLLFCSVLLHQIHFSIFSMFFFLLLLLIHALIRSYMLLYDCSFYFHYTEYIADTINSDIIIYCYISHGRTQRGSPDNKHDLIRRFVKCKKWTSLLLSKCTFQFKLENSKQM